MCVCMCMCILLILGLLGMVLEPNEDRIICFVYGSSLMPVDLLMGSFVVNGFTLIHMAILHFIICFISNVYQSYCVCIHKRLSKIWSDSHPVKLLLLLCGVDQRGGEHIHDYNDDDNISNILIIYISRKRQTGKHIRTHLGLVICMVGIVYSLLFFPFTTRTRSKKYITHGKPSIHLSDIDLFACVSITYLRSKCTIGFIVFFSSIEWLSCLL